MFLFEISFALVDIQSKSTRLEVAKGMTQQLVIYANAGFQYLLIGDES
jgi:hypothetical protein